MMLEVGEGVVAQIRDSVGRASDDLLCAGKGARRLDSLAELVGIIRVPYTSKIP